MEYVKGGELFKYVDEQGCLEEPSAIGLFRQLVEAVYYCHRLRISHRDLKPENILLDREKGLIKLIDFGMAAYQPDNQLLETPCGSPHYAAPELLSNQLYDGSMADVWSLGVVLFVILTGDPPYNYRTDVPKPQRLSCLYEQIRKGQYTLPNYLSFHAKDLIRRIFVVDPKRRITIRDLWHHPFMHKYDREFGYLEKPSLEDWIGPAPVLSAWAPLTPDLLDLEILKNLMTLWHDAEEAILVEKLCSNESVSQYNQSGCRY
jgi:serine/threonine-protein kinase HSL1 (negative regulator of Swe1 kinase)